MHLMLMGFCLPNKMDRQVLLKQGAGIGIHIVRKEMRR